MPLQVGMRGRGCRGPGEGQGEKGVGSQSLFQYRVDVCDAPGWGGFSSNVLVQLQVGGYKEGRKWVA